MPVTITIPRDTGLIGPGLEFHVHTDLVGPLTIDSKWSIVVSPDNEFANWTWVQTFPTFGDRDADLRLMTPENTNFGPAGLNPVDGATMYMDAKLIEGLAEVDNGIESFTWDGKSGIGEMVWAYRAVAGQGLSTAQAQELADNHAAINPPLVAQDGTPITGAVGDAIIRPALKFLGIDTTAYVLQGQGTLDVPNIGGIQTAWGLVLDVMSYPSGSGYMPGYVRSFHKRPGQFLLLWPAKNTAEAMVIDELRLHLEHFTWTWDYANVIAVAYYIEPGWTVQARFVSAFFP